MRLSSLVCAAALCAGLTLASASPAAAQAATVSELRSRLNAAGDRLDRATEGYDQAHNRRESAKIAGLSGQATNVAEAVIQQARDDSGAQESR